MARTAWEKKKKKLPMDDLLAWRWLGLFGWFLVFLVACVVVCLVACLVFLLLV